MGRLLVVAALLGLPLSAQEPSEPIPRCFVVVLTPTVDDASPDPTDRAFRTEFRYTPNFRTEAEPWVVPSPPSISEARWWLDDELTMLAAWMVEGRLLALRLRVEDGGLRGQAFRTPELRDPQGEVRAQPTPC